MCTKPSSKNEAMDNLRRAMEYLSDYTSITVGKVAIFDDYDGEAILVSSEFGDEQIRMGKEY